MPTPKSKGHRVRFTQGERPQKGKKGSARTEEQKLASKNLKKSQRSRNYRPHV
jgi:hypothetical protein